MSKRSSTHAQLLKEIGELRARLDEAEAKLRAVRGGEHTPREDEALFAQLFEFAPDAIVVMDRQGRIARVNTRVEAVFGYRAKELIGWPVEMLMPPAFRERHARHRVGYLAQPRLRQMGAGMELYGRRKDGSKFPVDIMLAPVHTRDGLIVLSIIRDITERKQFEQMLREQNVELENAVLAKDRLLASMSHELRTPLNAIIGFAGTLNANQEKHLQTIQASAKHLLSLINNLLDLAKIESGKVALDFEPVACRSMIEEVAAVLRPLAEHKGLKFEINVPRPDLVVQSDRRALSQIIFNLASNAINFTEKGEVRLEIKQRQENGQRVTEIRVADTGIGIRPADQARLFQAFEQPHVGSARYHQGTELGLHLSQKLAGLLGAHIIFESESGKGSAFAVVLPER